MVGSVGGKVLVGSHTSGFVRVSVNRTVKVDHNAG